VGKDITTPDRDRKLVHSYWKIGTKRLLTLAVQIPYQMSDFRGPTMVSSRISSYNEISGRYTEMKEEFYLPQTCGHKKKN
jgi:thymidylate synthase ThyX